MGERGPLPGTKRLEMTPERIETFLTVLRSSGGVWSAACQAASPHSEHRRRGYTAFKKLRLRDREFDEACAQIIEQCADDLEAELIRRAVSGDENFVFQKGEQVFMADGTPAVHCRKSDALLLAALKAARPERFGDKKTVDVHHHKSAGSHWEITAQDFKLLSTDQKRALADIVSTVQAGTRAIEHRPGVTLDVPVIEVDADYVEVMAAAGEESEAEAMADLEKDFPY